MLTNCRRKEKEEKCKFSNFMPTALGRSLSVCPYVNEEKQWGSRPHHFTKYLVSCADIRTFTQNNNSPFLILFLVFVDRATDRSIFRRTYVVRSWQRFLVLTNVILTTRRTDKQTRSNLLSRLDLTCSLLVYFD